LQENEADYNVSLVLNLFRKIYQQLSQTRQILSHSPLVSDLIYYYFIVFVEKIYSDFD